MNYLTPKFYTPRNLSRNALNPNNLKPGAAQSGASNALSPASYSQPPYWASEGASVNAPAASEPGAIGMSDPAISQTMSMESMTQAQQDQGKSITGVMSAIPGPIGMMAGIANKAFNVVDAVDAPSPDAGGGGANPGPGNGGPSASSPAGGAQAAGGHAPGTGTPGDPGQGGGDGGDGGKVICTELHQQGLMPEHIWRADEEFAKTVDPDVRAGYLCWGLPVVRMMRKSKAFTLFVSLFAKPWSEHMAYEMGAIEKDNAFGRLLMKIGVPLCRVIGGAHRRGIVLAR